MESELKQTQDLVEKMQNSAQDLTDRAKRLGAMAWERTKNGYLTVQDKTAAGAKATDAAIRSHPYQTVGIAFGVGLLLGLLFRRKD